MFCFGVLYIFVYKHNLNTPLESNVMYDVMLGQDN